MTDDEIKILMEESLGELLKKDAWLLAHDLSEQSIAHRLAVYLEGKFKEYDVDCEYNGNVDSLNNKKVISLLKTDLQRVGLLRKKELGDVEREFTNRAVFPDIIIHQRGKNDYNLCIVEIKKSTSKISFNYDHLKLKAYTSDMYDNTLFYQLGIFVELVIDKDNPSYKLRTYKKGNEIPVLLQEKLP